MKPWLAVVGIGEDGIAAQVQELRGPAEKTTQTVRMYLTRALSFLFDPSLARSVSPRADNDDSSLCVMQLAQRFDAGERVGETIPVQDNDPY